MLGYSNMDRTFEFRSAIDTISGGRFAHGNSSNTIGNNQFLDKATGISQEFTKISLKLDQLNKIARNKSIFDDKPEEFEDLSNVLKRELTVLNRRIQELKNANNNINNKAENVSKTVSEHERNVILILQNLTAQSFKSFENICEVRSQNLKSKRDRKDQFGSGGNDRTGSNFMAFRAATPPPATKQQQQQSSPQASPLKQRPIDPAFSNAFAQAPISHIETPAVTGATNTGYNKKFDDQTHVSIDFSNQQQTLMMEQEPLLASDSRTLRARNNALGAIESTINELGTIYQQLAHLVAEQGETVQRIDFNIEDMNINVLSGQNQLARYLRRVSSNRFLIAKLFAALILFIIIFKFLFL